MASLNFQTQTVMKKVGMSSKATTREACGGQDLSRQIGSTPGCRGQLIYGKLSLGGGAGKFLVYRGDRSFRRHSVLPHLSKGGNLNFESFKKGGNLEKNFEDGENQKGGQDFQK